MVADKLGKFPHEVMELDVKELSEIIAFYKLQNEANKKAVKDKKK